MRGWVPLLFFLRRAVVQEQSGPTCPHCFEIVSAFPLILAPPPCPQAFQILSYCCDAAHHSQSKPGVPHFF